MNVLTAIPGGLVNLSYGASCVDEGGSGTFAGDVASLTTPPYTTGWCPNNGSGTYAARVDLGVSLPPGAMTICAATLQAGDQHNNPVNWFLEWATSTSGPWTQVVSYNLNYATVSFGFPAVTARYWHVLPDPATTSGHMNQYEIALFGVGGVILG